MPRIDLHLHSTASDGTDRPAALAEQAASLGLAAIAVTDHDSVEGVAEAMEAGAHLGVEVVPGIEVSSDYRDNNIHILGYFVDISHPALRTVLDWVSVERDERNRKMCAMLSADGFDITMEELLSQYPAAVLGRPHVAELMVRKGYVSSVAEGFDRYLEVGRPYFLPKRRIGMDRAIETIHKAGGVSVLAHPFQYRDPLDETVELIEYARDLGVMGLECYYSENTPEQQAWLLSRAEKYALGVSGGSDCHGARKPHIRMGSGIDGSLCVPASVLAELKVLASKKRPE